MYHFRATLPPHQQNWDKLHLLMNFWRLPSIFLHDVEECCCPDKGEGVKRRFTMKIVPLQLPAPTCHAVTRHVYNTCEDICCESKVECEMVYGTRPWMEDFANDHYEAARKANIQVNNNNIVSKDNFI